jgi:PAS domain S-box-containing protein
MNPRDGHSPAETSLLQERLAAVVEMATDAIIVIDEGGRIRLFNAAAERLFAWPEPEAIGHALERLIHPRLHTRYRVGMDRWRRANPQVGDFRGRSIWWASRTTGEMFPCEVSIAQCRIGTTLELMITVRDITERGRTAKATRHRVELERFLFDLSRTFIAIPEASIDANMTEGLARVGTVLEMDRVTLLELSHDREAMTVTYSWSQDEVAGPPGVLTKQMQPWWLAQVLRGDVSLAGHVDDLPEEAAAEKAYLRERGVMSAASIPLTVGGEIAGAISFITTRRHVSWTPELVNQLRAIGDILWNALKRRQAMDALIAARQTARESEERFRLIANTAPIMIWMSDVDKQVTYVNQRWLDFTGWPPSVTPGHRWIELIHPDDVERCGEVYTSAFDQRQPFEVEHRLRRHDGEYRWTVTVGVPRYGTDGSFAGYVGTGLDVTDRRDVGVALRESHEELQERTIELERRTTQLSQMASDLTLAEQRAREELAKTLHDGLQQLLTIAAMNVESQIMREAQRGTLSDELVQAKNHLQEAIAAARSLSVELFPPVLQTAGLPTALRWLADWSQRKYGLEVEVTADPQANSDRKDVRTLLFGSVRELLFNVVKHARVHRVTVDLALASNDTLCITVTDQGVGFDPTELELRAKVSQVGWGLFSIRERLLPLGGRLDIESVPGRGTTFRLIAPRDTGHHVGAGSPSHAALEPPARHVSPTEKSDALRILIADDQPALRKTFRKLLEEWTEFHVVGEATNGVDAITQAHALRPDVVLMDVSMPEMDGVEATRRIRAELPFIQILGFSVHPRTDDPHPIELAGAEGYFNKGFDTERLIDRLLLKHASRPSGPAGKRTWGAR